MTFIDPKDIDLSLYQGKEQPGGPKKGKKKQTDSEFEYDEDTPDSLSSFNSQITYATRKDNKKLMGKVLDEVKEDQSWEGLMDVDCEDFELIKK